MVKFFFIFGWFVLLFGIPLQAQNVVIESSIDQNQGLSNVPLTGTITITHHRKATVDEKSFQLGQKPLSATLTQETNITPGEEGTVVSIYGFELPAKQKGLYTLDPISVKVGGKTYQSQATTYEVKEMGTNTPQSLSKKTTSVDNSPIVFKLEAAVKGPAVLYPGQRAQLFYRITYNRSIDLTTSNLPLLYTQEFHKVGDEQVKDYEKGNLTYQDITQEIEAYKPGTFHYPASSIEGYAYQLNNLGQKAYISNKLHAEAPPVEVIVKPFPIDKRPASFTEGVGKIDAKLTMRTPTEINLGSQIALELTVTGLTNLAEFELPDLHCQPGFSGFFELNDLPPLAFIKDEVKHFRVELRPISTFVHEIPSIELSSFDPQTQAYLVWRSEPIPLKINSSALPKTEIVSETALVNPLDILAKWTQPHFPLPPLEIKGREVKPEDLTFNWLGTRWVLWMIPLGVLLFLLQRHLLKEWKKQRQQMKQSSSEELLHKALNRHLNLGALLQQLQAAFLQRLIEKGYVSDQTKDIESFSSTGLLGEIRSFILNLEALRYGTQQEYNLEQIRQEAQALFAKIY